jgi:prepilin-type N-terminal cleavage/methylation domain-containing protein
MRYIITHEFSSQKRGIIMKRAFVKKAFTLAELSIVLVVLGIIIAMTLKGFGVLDAARLRNELGKINKFQTAYSLYFERMGRILPAAINTPPAIDGKLDHTPLYEFGLLDDDAEHNRDFTEKLDPDVENNLFLSLCNKNPITSDSDNFSFGTVAYADAGMADGVCLVFYQYLPSFICGAETSYDDMKVFDGSGASWVDTEMTILTVEEALWVGTNTKGKYNCTLATPGSYKYAWAYMVM